MMSDVRCVFKRKTSKLNGFKSKKDPGKTFVVHGLLSRGRFGSVYLVSRKRKKKKLALKIILIKNDVDKENSNKSQTDVTKNSEGRDEETLTAPQDLNSCVKEVKLQRRLAKGCIFILSILDALFVESSAQTPCREIWLTYEYFEEDVFHVSVLHADRREIEEMYEIEPHYSKLPLRQPCGISYQRIRIIGASVALALEHMHKMNIYHGDIKGANILLSSDGRVRLTDFGEATELGKPCDVDRVFGSMPYMAPEMVLDDFQVGLPIDIWSFGCLLQEMDRGTPPFFQYVNHAPEGKNGLLDYVSGLADAEKGIKHEQGFDAFEYLHAVINVRSQPKWSKELRQYVGMESSQSQKWLQKKRKNNVLKFKSPEEDQHTGALRDLVLNCLLSSKDRFTIKSVLDHVFLADTVKQLREAGDLVPKFRKEISDLVKLVSRHEGLRHEQQVEESDESVRGRFGFLEPK